VSLSDLPTDDVRKSAAIALHSGQADMFDARYHALEQDPYSSTFTYGRRKIEELIQAELAKLPAGARVLDAGCGTGFNVHRLKEQGFDVVGLEPAEGMRQVARRDNPDVQIVDGDVEHLPFPDASFDFVLCIEVIRYFERPDRAIGEIRRVLRPGGTAFITAAPLLSLSGYALVNMVTSRVRIPTFTKVRVSFMTVAGARRAARAAGFGSVRVHGAFLGPWHLLGRLSPGTLSRALRRFEPIDDRLADRRYVRDLTNHLAIIARAPRPRT
jgi:ubiquinone/menaquinone biosynthesis C-methylase UbiE